MKIHFLTSFNLILFSVTFVEKFGIILNRNEEESSSAQNRIRRYDITKGTSDKRLYRGLQLENDLKIILISNPDVGSATVGMTVGAGSLNDFDDLPGTANFFGEILNRMGTSTDPDQEFGDIIRSRLNPDLYRYAIFPNTKEDKQSFHFGVDADYLAPALEIFAQFFKEPYLLSSNSRSQLERYIQDLEWLYVSNILSEHGNKWKLQQLQKSISAVGHPFNHSSHGSPETFTEFLVEEDTSNEFQSSQDEGFEPRQTKLHSKLRKFYSKWYSSNTMCLVVLGKDSLDELERMTVPLFEDIQNKRVEKLTFSYEQHPWGQEQLRRKIYTDFDSDSAAKDKVVRLVFRVPDIRHQHKTAPEFYVIEFLKRREPNSLISLLEKKKLCVYLKSKYEAEAGIGFFTIKCEISFNSDTHEDEVVEFILQYIHSLKKSGIHEWIFEENRQRSYMQFSKTPLLENVESIASAMQVYSMEDVLSYNYLRNEWKPSLIDKFLSYLTPDNMKYLIPNIINFDRLKLELPRNERLKKYSVTRNSVLTMFREIYMMLSKIQKWKTVDALPDFQVPQRNEFLIENWDDHPLIEDEPENPYVVHESSRSRFWFLQMKEYPHIRVKFHFFDLKGHWNPLSTTLFCIFSRLLNHSIIEYTYALQVSGYDWTIIPGEEFIVIYVSGYLDKIQTVLRKIISKISVELLTGRNLLEPFEKAKAECIEKYRGGWDFPEVLHRFKHLLKETSTFWASDEMSITSRSLEFKDWKKFITRLLSDVYIQGLILGSCTKDSAVDLVKTIEEPFRVATKLIPQIKAGLLPRVVEIEGGKHFIDILFRETRNEQSHLHYTYYQFGPGTPRNMVVSSLLINMITKKCHYLNQDNLVVQNSLFKTYSIIGLLFWTFPTKLHPDHVDSQFEDCLRKVYILLQELTVIQFDEYVKSAIENESSVPPSMIRYWDDLTRGFYTNVSVEDDMRPVTKLDTLAFFEDVLDENSPNRRKYTVLVYHKNFDRTSLRPIPGAIKVEDVMDFKNNSYLYQLPIQFMRLNFVQQERVGM